MWYSWPTLATAGHLVCNFVQGRSDRVIKEADMISKMTESRILLKHTKK